MCGIYFSSKIFSESLVKQKIDLIAHRGPNARQVIFKSGLIFGHTRLSIIDLDKRSDQPYQYGPLTIVFNGEIYNFLKIRKALIKEGMSFKTEGDTEVLAALFLVRGDDAFRQLQGMFAAVIFDSRTQRITCVRDRCGKKPLFYRRHGKAGLELGSSVRQLAAFDQSTLNMRAVSQYFKYKYISGEETIYSEIHRVPPGYVLTFDRKGELLERHRFWEPPVAAPISFADIDEVAEEFLPVFRESVRDRLVADVPVGLFLSSGVDSSLIASALNDLGALDVRAYTVKFAESRLDESDDAKRIASFLGLEHEVIEGRAIEPEKGFWELSKAYDEPFADPSALPSLALCKAVGSIATVALSGDGADEVFWGYNRYKLLHRARYLYMLNKAWRRAAASGAKALGFDSVATALCLGDASDFYDRLMTGRPNTSVLSERESSFQVEKASKQFDVNGAAHLDLINYLPNDINVKMDRASMWNGLEVRAPFQDYRVVEFASKVPPEFKMTWSGGKRVLKTVIHKRMPEKLISQNKKGFTPPLAEWLRTSLKETMLDLLSEEGLRDFPFIETDRVTHLVAGHLSGKKNNQNELWKLMCFSAWSRGGA